jgi:pyrimidine operon attenuation protein/uracil phosphoribosyltransferase
METKNYFMDEATAAKKLQRMAYEIAEQNMEETGELILAGIRDNGVTLANIIAGYLKDILQSRIKVIEISLDKRHPDVITISEEISFNEAVVILVDDVVNSGKTLLYALKPFLSFHPKKIQTLTLVERTHKMFPVASDYVGISLATTLQEHIFVEVEENRVKGAYLV